MIKHTWMMSVLLMTYLVYAQAAEPHPKSPPNILFIIADDASCHFGESYGCKWVKTPNIDRLAREGLVFENAYTPTGKCAPSRSSILTGRNPWQLEEGANHQPIFSAKYKAFSEVLREGGILVGGQGKIWGPGIALTQEGSHRNFGFQDARSLGQMLKNRTPDSKPFFFWVGSHHPHRGYKLDSGVTAGKKPEDIDRVPSFWPDNLTVRKDMLDYAVEVEKFDEEVGNLLLLLRESGEEANTLIIVTSDNGMPFPRSKGHTYNITNHEPLVIRWPAGIVNPGRRVTEFVSFIDLAPTFLELYGLDAEKGGMQPLTGRSLVPLLRGKSDPSRDFVILGRERNDSFARPGSKSGLGFPSRTLRVGNWFYTHNFEADRWPCGNPELGLLDTDGSPTKSFIMDLPTNDRFWQLCFGKRPEAELYDLSKDPDCVSNLAAHPAQAERITSMRERLFAELAKQNDPRILGQGSIFDEYKSAKEGTTKKNFK